MHTRELHCFSLWYLCFHPVYLHLQHRQGSDIFHLFPVLPDVLDIPKGKLQSNGNKASAYFRSF
jgi:hypothetical protein